jgi:hypothetical protein
MPKTNSTGGASESIRGIILRGYQQASGILDRYARLPSLVPCRGAVWSALRERVISGPPSAGGP